MSRRLVFMGSDAIALPALDWIWEHGRTQAEIIGVFTQPDRPSGRGQKLTPSAIKQWAVARGLPVHQPEKLTPAELGDLAALRPDALLVMAYGHLLRQDWLDLPPRGVWNLHASVLPELRGASPIQGAVLAGGRESGVTLMRMILRMDAGPVLDVERVLIDPRETAATLEAKLAAACTPLLARNMAGLFDPAPSLSNQDESRATYTRRLRKEDSQLDFHAPAAVLARRINGLFPWPGTFLVHGDVTIRVGLAEPVDVPNGGQSPGTVIGQDAGGLVVAAGESAVRFLRLQRPGGRMLDAPDFLRGHPVPVGTLIPSGPMPELVSREPFKRLT